MIGLFDGMMKWAFGLSLMVRRMNDGKEKEGGR